MKKDLILVAEFAIFASIVLWMLDRAYKEQGKIALEFDIFMREKIEEKLASES